MDLTNRMSLLPVSASMLGFPILAAVEVHPSLQLITPSSVLQRFRLLLPLPTPQDPALLEFLWVVGWRGGSLEFEMVVTLLCIDNKSGKPDPAFVSKLNFQILTRKEETDV